MTEVCNSMLRHLCGYGVYRCTGIGLLGKAMLVLISNRRDYINATNKQ